MATNVVPLKNSRAAPKAVQSSMETMVLSLKDIANWKTPPFQRPIRINEKVRLMAEELKADGCSISGILTLGRIANDPNVYIVDGQHRLEGFKLSELPEVLADVRICRFQTMGDMADEFVRLNTALVRMRPDDVLRGLEPSAPALQTIRKDCPFVGYDQIRRNNNRGPVVSMSAVLRFWAGSSGETPSSYTGSAAQLATNLDEASAKDLILFLLTARAAWGSDVEYARLWSGLNLAVCMWMFRRLVLDRDRSGNKRFVVLNIAQFKQCLMSVSANRDYLDWLPGRSLGDRDRTPCYTRLKTIFIRRLTQESPTARRPMLPQPFWSN